MLDRFSTLLGFRRRCGSGFGNVEQGIPDPPLAANAERDTITSEGELQKGRIRNWTAEHEGIGELIYSFTVKHPMVIRVIGECLLDALDGAGDISFAERSDGYRHSG